MKLHAEDLVSVRCEWCGREEILTAREESRLPPGPFYCSDRCEDSQAECYVPADVEPLDPKGGAS